MSNPYDPNAPPPTWGAPPNAPQYNPPGPTQQGAWNPGPYAAPPASGGSGSKWVIGCLVVLGIIAACCGGTIFFAFRYSRNIGTEVLQQQATAMGVGNYPEVCRHNSPTLQTNTPCDQYVAWLSTNAPWFAGAVITGESVNIESDATRGARFTVRISGTGARGSGHLTFAIVPIGGEFFVDAIVAPR